jgi:hypothetical protein
MSRNLFGVQSTVLVEPSQDGDKVKRAVAPAGKRKV